MSLPKNANKKIAVVTGTRAEYGLLYYLLKEIKADAAFDLQIIATCMHLSPEFGLTYQLIEQDGFYIDEKVEMLLSSDTSVGITKSVGLGLIGFADAFARLKPDVVVILGDRFETLAAAQAAMFARIPVAHIHGGELSEGAIDDAIRHSITKMSCLHFVAANPYRNRVIQMGENPDNVYCYGAPGLERIERMHLLDRKTLESALNFIFGETTFLITYHPATLDLDDNDEMEAIFSAIDQFPRAKVIFTKANADEAGREINKKIDQYVFSNKSRCVSFTTMGDLHYLSALQFVSVVIGNSSSGLIEVPNFHKPTINIGTRQNNRLRSLSVIDCDGDKKAIISAINQALSVKFTEAIKKTKSIYIQDFTSSKIVSILKDRDLKQVIKKHFYDLEGLVPWKTQ
jgi:GDP/UDP-N,N'-diacetylbacillosamine 2-epimerase (hydrolysing)